MKTRPILLVEDSADDALLMQRAIRAAGIENPVTLLADGELALKHFDRAARQLPRPCLVLLDIKLPYQTGLELLRHLRSRPEYRALAVIILTSSSEPSDVATALELGANAYVIKPSAYRELMQLVSAAGRKAAALAASLPPRPRAARRPRDRKCAAWLLQQGPAPP